jgi:hypothetical protein
LLSSSPDRAKLACSIASCSQASSSNPHRASKQCARSGQRLGLLASIRAQPSNQQSAASQSATSTPHRARRTSCAQSNQHPPASTCCVRCARESLAASAWSAPHLRASPASTHARPAASPPAVRPRARRQHLVRFLLAPTAPPLSCPAPPILRSRSRRFCSFAAHTPSSFFRLRPVPQFLRFVRVPVTCLTKHLQESDFGILFRCLCSVVTPLFLFLLVKLHASPSSTTTTADKIVLIGAAVPDKFCFSASLIPRRRFLPLADPK